MASRLFIERTKRNESGVERHSVFGIQSEDVVSGRMTTAGIMSRRQEREQKIERCLVNADSALRAAFAAFGRAVSTTTTEKLLSVQSIAAQLHVKAIGRNAHSEET